jgi:hypothetical protein
MRSGRVFGVCVLASTLSAPACAPDEGVAARDQEAAPEEILHELVFSPADAGVAAELGPVFDEGITAVEEFFGQPYREAFTIDLLPDRGAFDDSFPPAWGLSRTECWMVATGVADALRMLSPRAWSTEACEHDPEDAAHVRDIVVHELTHVFHGQHNPTGDFVGAEEIGWFAEGLAVVVSGQLAEKRLDARAAVESGQVPARLTDAWSGQYRYGVAGSMVAFMEDLVGRSAIFAALRFTRQSELLALVELSEEDFLGAWSEYVLDSPR